MAKPGYVQLAEHFVTDTETVTESEYQPGQFTKPVYSLNGALFAAGKQKPKHKYDEGYEFKKAETWTQHTIWIYVESEQ